MGQMGEQSRWTGAPAHWQASGKAPQGPLSKSPGPRRARLSWAAGGGSLGAWGLRCQPVSLLLLLWGSWASLAASLALCGVLGLSDLTWDPTSLLTPALGSSRRRARPLAQRPALGAPWPLPLPCCPGAGAQLVVTCPAERAPSVPRGCQGAKGSEAEPQLPAGRVYSVLQGQPASKGLGQQGPRPAGPCLSPRHPLAEGECPASPPNQSPTPHPCRGFPGPGSGASSCRFHQGPNDGHVSIPCALPDRKSVV